MLNSLYYDNYYSNTCFIQNIFFLFLLFFYLSFIIEQNINKIKFLHLILFIFLFFLIYLHDEWTVSFYLNFINYLDTNWSWSSFKGLMFFNEIPDYHLNTYIEFLFLCFTFILSLIMFGFCNNILMKSNKDFEFSWLIYIFLICSFLLFMSYSFIEIFILLECLGLSSYILISIERTKKLSATAGIQYLILSSIPSCLFILGNIYIYQNYGTFFQENIEVFLESSIQYPINIDFYNNVIVNIDKNLNQVLNWLGSFKVGALKRVLYVDTHMEFRLKYCSENRIRMWYKRDVIMPYYDMFNVMGYKNLAIKSFIEDDKYILRPIVNSIERQKPDDIDMIFFSPYINTNASRYPWDSPKFLNLWYENGVWDTFLYISKRNFTRFSNMSHNIYIKSYDLMHIPNPLGWGYFMAPKPRISQEPSLMEHYDHNTNKYVYTYSMYSCLDTLKMYKEPFLKSYPCLDMKYHFIPKASYLLLTGIKRFEINNEILFCLNKDVHLFNDIKYKNFFFNKYVFLSINLALLLIIINLSFKITAAPFHIWAPVIYNNGSLASVLFLNIFSKFILILFFLTILTSTFYSLKTDWSFILFIMSFLSILFGMLNAFNEKLIKKFFVYSSMTDVGFIILGISFYNIQIHKYILNYLFIYNFSSLIIWFILLYLNKYTKYLTNIRMILAGDLILNIIFSLNIFSLAGIPPFGGFFIKLDLLIFLISSSKFFISFIILLFTVVNFFYYLRFIKMIYFDNILTNKTYNKIDEFKFFIFALLINIVCGFEIYMQNSFVFIIENILQSCFS